MKQNLFSTLLNAAIATGLASFAIVSCAREPVLYLHRDCLINMDVSVHVSDLHTMWNYEDGYDYEKEWIYGWDSEDQRIFGPMGYHEMNEFQIRRYFLGKEAGGKHTNVRANYLKGKNYKGTFEFGYHDILAWNEIEAGTGGQAIRLLETLDSVVAYTGQSQVRALSYPGTNSQKAYNEPEMLFSGNIKELQITDNPKDYGWNEELHCYEKQVTMDMQPVTYIYLVQFILHNNKERITMIQGDSNLSAMSAGVSLNTCRTLDEAVTVNYQTRFKKNLSIPATGEKVDVIGGKLTTFGICGTNPTKVSAKAELSESDPRHYIDLNVTFHNGMDSTMVFDVTDRVKDRYKGGVITIELDVDKIDIPVRPGGSGFDAVVKDPNEENYEIVV